MGLKLKEGMVYDGVHYKNNADAYCNIKKIYLDFLANSFSFELNVYVSKKDKNANAVPEKTVLYTVINSLNSISNFEELYAKAYNTVEEENGEFANFESDEI